MLYNNPIIEEHTPEIATLFQLENYKIVYDEHYEFIPPYDLDDDME